MVVECDHCERQNFPEMCVLIDQVASLRWEGFGGSGLSEKTSLWLRRSVGWKMNLASSRERRIFAPSVRVRINSSYKNPYKPTSKNVYTQN